MVDKTRTRRSKKLRTKSDAVRELLTKDPDMMPTEIVKALKKQGVSITPSSAGGIKSGWRKANVKAPVKGADSHAPVTVEELMQVKRLADRVGGIVRLRAAVDALILLGK